MRVDGLKLPVLTALLAASPVWSQPSVSEKLLDYDDDCFIRSASVDGRFLGCRTSSGGVGIIDRDRSERIVFIGGGGHFSVYGPVIAPDGARIVASWVADGRETHELRVFDITGASTVVFRERNASGEPLAWSRDGRFIAANLVGSDGVQSLVVLGADGGSMRTLARYEGAFPRNVRFSHDGRHLVYARYPNAPSIARDLFVRPIDGSRDSPLTQLPGEELFPFWLASGRGIFFLRSRNGSSDAWLVPMKGGEASGPPQKLHPDVGDIAPFALTDDGDLYFTSVTGLRDLYTAEVDFARGKVTTPPSPIASAMTGMKMRPSFSPDGRHLLYVSLRGWGPRTAVVIRDLESGEERVDASLRSVHLPVWSRDGSSVLVRGTDANGHEGTFAMNPDTGTHSEIPNHEHADAFSRLAEANDAHLTTVEKLLEFDSIRHLTVHPDGRRIAFVAGRRVFEHRVMPRAIRPSLLAGQEIEN